MKNPTFGMVAAAAVASLVGTMALAETTGAGDAKACYRKSCGKSVQGHEGSCAGTKVGELTDQAACEKAGGAWMSKVDAEKTEMK